MSLHNIKNFVYYSSDDEQKQTDDNNTLILDQKIIEKLLQSLANKSMQENAPTFKDLENVLQGEIKESNSEYNRGSEQNLKNDDTKSITKYLLKNGYLKDEKNWLTKKGFFSIGNQILRDLMNNLKTGELGLHETKHVGVGTTTLDTTKKFETGDDLKQLNVSATILNTISRHIKQGIESKFPLSMDIDDFEEFDTIEDVQTSLVYCIDLSSTMKSSLSDSGMSRIEAAKRALWSLYVLNDKFFPNDSISIVGFASMASVINPYDIPFLKTYDANDEFLHYTNYQAAFRLARKILQKNSTKNKRIVMITDGQPSACFVDNESQKTEIMSEKPYSNFYTPSNSLLSKIRQERNLKIDQNNGSLVYLCYRYKKVDPKINQCTLNEAKKCKRENIQIDSIVVSEEIELLEYVQQMEKHLYGKTYHINQNNMDKVLMIDYLYNTKKILSSKNN